jgi:hypothetical protein
MVDEGKLNAFIGKSLNDLGGAFSVPMIRMGDRLGLYKTLHESGPLTVGELAKKAGSVRILDDLALPVHRYRRILKPLLLGK